MAHVLVWDLETILDLKGFAAANGHNGKTEDEIGVARQISPSTSPTRCSFTPCAWNCRLTALIALCWASVMTLRRIARHWA